MDASKITLFPAVNAAIRNAEGKYLLTRRSRAVREPGVWCFPGGHLDPGETWYAACVREVAEEVGLKVSGGKLVGIYSDPSLNVVPHPRAPGGLGQFLAAVFLFEHGGDEVRFNNEVEEAGWYAPAQLPEPFQRSHQVRMQDVVEFRGEAFFR